MNLGSILDYLSLLTTDRHKTREQIIIKIDDEKFTFPITPSEINYNDGQNNKVINIVNLGEILVFGMPKLKSISFTTFFPNRDYPFIVGDNKPASECKSYIQKLMRANKPVRLIIPSLDVNMLVAICDFSPKKQENTGDIYFSIEFKEWRNTADIASLTNDTTGLNNRPNSMAKPDTATMVTTGADILDVAKKSYGDYRHWRRVAQGNNLTTLVINNPSRLRKLVIK